MFKGLIIKWSVVPELLRLGSVSISTKRLDETFGAVDGCHIPINVPV